MDDSGCVSLRVLLFDVPDGDSDVVSATSLVGIGGGGGGPSTSPSSSPPSSFSFCSKHFVKFLFSKVALLGVVCGRVPPMLLRYSDGLMRQFSPLAGNLGGMNGRTSCLLCAAAGWIVSASLPSSPPPVLSSSVRRPTLNTSMCWYLN